MNSFVILAVDDQMTMAGDQIACNESLMFSSFSSQLPLLNVNLKIVLFLNIYIFFLLDICELKKYR